MRAITTARACRALLAAMLVAGLDAGLVTLGHSARAESGSAKHYRFILVGDSTIASNSGYGDALCARVIAGDTCINLASAGRSSASFRREGRWDHVTALLRNAGPYHATYVLIQFGHNDQPGKPGHSTDLQREYPANLARYVEEARALGAVPVLVTPLTRRTFVDGVLDNNLRPWAQAALTVAAQNNAIVLDLNAASHAAVQAMGQGAADTLAVVPRPAGYIAPPILPGAPPAPGAALPATTPATPFDRTHLGRKGAELFSRMVRDGLTAAIPGLAGHFGR